MIKIVSLTLILLAASVSSNQLIHYLKDVQSQVGDVVSVILPANDTQVIYNNAGGQFAAICTVVSLSAGDSANVVLQSLYGNVFYNKTSLDTPQTFSLKKNLAFTVTFSTDAVLNVENASNSDIGLRCVTSA